MTTKPASKITDADIKNTRLVTATGRILGSYTMAGKMCLWIETSMDEPVEIHKENK